MRRIFVFTSLICAFAFTAAAWTNAADLSDDIPASVQQLPTLGTVQWTASNIPHIPVGPSGGISGMGMVDYGGDIYLMGGFIPAGDGTADPGYRTSRWLHRYDTDAGAWAQLDNMPGRREYGRATVLGDDIYFVGGGEQMKNQTPAYAPRADVFTYDLTGENWQNALPAMSVPRTHTSIGCVGNKLIVAGGNKYNLAQGGYSANTIQGVVEVLDLDHPEQGWTQAASIPGEKRGWSATAVVGDKLYMLGGLTFDQNGNQVRLKKSLAYDPSNDAWTALAAPPLAISGWEGAVLQNRYILAAGGVAQIDGQSSVAWGDMLLAYDTQTDAWFKFDTPLPTGGVLNDPGVCVIGDTIYIAGAEGPNCSHYNHLLIGKITHLPEPGTVAMTLAAGLAGLTVFVRKKMRQ